MRNNKGISLIALIITIIVIIILAAIVIGGVFNTPNDAKFANFCQEYDRVQTAVQLKYYELYQNYAIDGSLTEIPTHYEIYNEVATNTKATTLTGTSNIDADGWVKISNWANLCEKPSGLVDDSKGNIWYLRLNDGKLAYSGFEKEEGVMYYTPNVFASASGTTKVRAKLKLTGTEPNQTIAPDGAVTLSPAGGLNIAGQS